MTRAIMLSIVAVLPAFRALGQSVPNPPAFEVAEVKASATKDIGPGKERLLPGGRLELPHGTLKEFMAGAFGVQNKMIVGGPKWLDSDRFDIIAKAPDPNTPVPTLLLMLRALLGFKLEASKRPLSVLVIDSAEKSGEN